MKIFLSYASERAAVAEQIALALRGDKHDTFFDRSRFRPGDVFDGRIRDEIRGCDLFIFLISEESVTPGTYALTELKFAQEKWDHPQDGVLPIMVAHTPMANVPAYLRAVTVLTPSGNVAAEAAAAVQDWTRGRASALTNCTVADAFGWGCATAWTLIRPLAESLKLSVYLAIDGFGGEQWERRLEQMDEALPPLERYHESLMGLTGKLGLPTSSEVEVPPVVSDWHGAVEQLHMRVGQERDFAVKSRAICEVLEEHEEEVKQQLDRYWMTALMPASEELASHSSRHRVALAAGESMVALVLKPFRPPGLIGADFSPYQSLGGWFFARRTTRYIRIMSSEANRELAALGLDRTAGEPFEALSLSLISAIRTLVNTYPDRALSWNPFFAGHLFHLIEEVEPRFEGLRDRLAAKLESMD